jgi:hypothetical protein
MESDITHIFNPEIETIDEIGIGRSELILKFTEGLYRNRFLYVKTDVYFI